MLEGGIIAKLLDEKWKTFASVMFLKKMIFQILHLICMSLAIYMRPNFEDPLMRGLQPGTNMEDYDPVRYSIKIQFLFFIVMKERKLNKISLLTFGSISMLHNFPSYNII